MVLRGFFYHHIPRMTETPLSDRRRADALLAAGRPGEAIPLYRRLVDRFPDTASHLLALAWALHDSGQRREARDCFERLFQRELNRKVFTGFAYDELVRMDRAAGNWAGLLSVCQRAAAAHPEDAGLLWTLGDAYRSADRPAEAAAVFQRLTALTPDNPEAWCALGEARLAGSDPDGAEAACDRALQSLPGGDAASLLGRLADTLRRAGYPLRSQAAWRRCLALKPDDPRYWMGYGEALLAGGHWEDGEKAFTRAAGLRPAEAGACWHRLGNLFSRAGLPERSVTAWRRATAAEPGNPHYRLALAKACAAAGLTDEAAAALEAIQKQLSGKTG